ncbi:MAG: Phosphatidylinositol 3,5-bisphosphate-binding protein [Phylliscum demangeonii]|nr:MAG: Phosphatidylinositol 3,5-bisphosphate-binding protein [Phylliscum demangeonii]
MLGKSNYVALVGGGKQPRFSQNKVVVWDDSKQRVAITLEFRTQVHRVRLSRSRIVVVLQNSVHLYTFQSPPQKISVFETADNPQGLCCLGLRTLVFPGRTAGQLQLVELERGNVSIVPAHASPLRALELSPGGELLATASETGTLIRIFSTANCARLAELRRGVDPAVIFALAISPSSNLLAVTSDKYTLHIFDLSAFAPGGTLPAPHSDRARGASSLSSVSTTADDGGKHKWGLLGKIPMMPRVFSDVYSLASAPFEPPVDSAGAPRRAGSSHSGAAQVGGVHGRSSQGVIGWTSNTSLVVVGAGRDGKWERFAIGDADKGEKFCVREAWRRYLGGR